MTGSLIGRQLGRFQVVARLGAGGMGEVYRARDEHLQRDVALKVLTAAGDATGDEARRMRREAHALSTVNHPNIATIHDLIDVDGQHVLVMELIEGESLASRVTRGPVPPSNVLELARQIAAGLQEAHRHGVVHRDLKPANVMVTPTGQVKIVDFGIAAVAATADAATRTHFDTGAVSGTLPYMAPEQIAGGAIDARADVWALGVLLYELATGRRPFEAPNALLLADRILNRDPDPASALVSGLPPGLDAVITRALTKEPGARFQTLGEMLAALDAGAAVVPSIRRPVHIPTIGFVAVLVVAAGVWGWRTWATGGAAAPPERTTLVLVADPVNRTGDEAFDDTLVELLTTSLGQSSRLALYPRGRVADVLRRMQRDPSTPLSEAVGLEILQREGLDALVTTTLSRLGDAYVLGVTAQGPRGDVRSKVSETFTNPVDLTARIDAVVRQLRSDIGESAASVDASAPLEEVSSASLEAVRFYTQGLRRARAGHAAEAVVLYGKALELDPDFAMAHDALGLAYTNLQDMARAEIHLARAAGLAGRAPEAERHKILADYHMLTRDYEVACGHLQVLSELRPLDPVPLIALANCKGFRMDWPGARAAAERGLAMQDIPLGRAILARLQLLSGDVEAALGGATALLAAQPTSFPALFVAGRAQLLLGRVEDARETYDTMFTLGGEAETEAWFGRFDLARGTGRLADARAALESALRSANSRGNVLATARAATALAELARDTGDGALLTRAMALFPDPAPATGVYLHARTLAGVNQIQAARTVAERLVPLLRSSPADRSLGRLVDAERALGRGDVAGAVAAADDAFGFEQTVLARETQARAYAAAGRTREAIQAWRDVVARAPERVDSPDSPGFHRVVDARYQLALLLEASGDTAQAQVEFTWLQSVWRDADADEPRAAQAVRRQPGT
jgi:serine/threonine protein kinase/tetratricopeptide (TPR) repeat protein